MPDDLYQQYGHYSHRELYDMLMAGNPDQIQGMVTTWKSMETTITELAAGLRADLARLLEGWDSPAGREFDRRVGHIASFAQSLGEEFAAIQSGLNAMSLALHYAMRHAEPPDAYEPSQGGGDDQGHLSARAATIAFFSPAMGVVGGFLGHEVDVVEKERAHNRIIQLVCTLASDYRVIDYGTWPPKVPAAHPDTPGQHYDDAAPAEPPKKDPEPPKEKHPHAHDAGNVTGYSTPVPVVAGPAVVGGNVDDGQEWWRGTAPAIVGAIAAGGLIAAAVSHERDRDKNDRLQLNDDEGHDATTTGADGVLRAHAATGPSTTLGVDSSQGAATGVPAPSHDGTALAGTGTGGTDAGQGGQGGQGQGSPPPPPPTAGGFGGTGVVGGTGQGGVTGTGAMSSGGVIGGTDASGLAARGPDTHRWLSEGRMAWGGTDGGTDPTSLVRPDHAPVVEPEPEVE
jgi:hypothetical protein